jgi:CHASE3 domain sensor protein
MSKWTIAKRLIAGFSAVILVTLVLGGFAFSRLLSIDHDARRIAATPADKAAIEARIAERAADNNKTAKAYEATITLDEDRALLHASSRRRRSFEPFVRTSCCR